MISDVHRLTEATAHRIYTILVRRAGAQEHWRQQFVIAHTIDGCSEFRFQGALGFGGKYRSERWAVDCYPEDRTAARDEIVAHTNAELDSLRIDLESHR